MNRFISFFLFIFLVSISITGCSIRLSNTKVRDGGIFRSDDNGETWTQKVLIRQEKNRLITMSDVDPTSIVISPFNEDEIVVTTAANGIYGSTNGGETWSQTTLTTGNFPTFAFDPSNRAILYTSTGSNILKTTNEGTTWDIIYTDSKGEGIISLAVDWYDSSKVYAGTSAGTILKSVNYGNDWAILHSTKDPIKTLFFRSDDTRILFAETANRGIYRSNDAGVTWTDFSKTLSMFPGSNINAHITFAKSNPIILYMTSNYGLLKSIDGGDSWQQITTLVPPNTIPLRTVGIDPENENRIYFTVNNLLHKSEDGGKTWRTIETIQTSRLIRTLLVHPTKTGRLYIGTLKVKK
jgi:photosystem II stability/assembly factor-like uncharacterized protein